MNEFLDHIKARAFMMKLMSPIYDKFTITSSENYYSQSEQAMVKGFALHKKLTAEGYKQLGDGAFADCYVKEVVEKK